MLSWGCMWWLSGWPTGWAAPHGAVGSSMLHAWACCPECARTPPPPRHHVLSDTITRAWTERHSTEGWRRRETHTVTHTKHNNTYITKRHTKTHTHTHTHIYTYTPFSSYTDFWYSAEGSDWLIKRSIVCCKRKTDSRQRLTLSRTSTETQTQTKRLLRMKSF